jgi:Immunity protein 8
MYPEIKFLHSSDVDDIETFIPDIADYFGFSLQIMAGPPGTPGQESFEMVVCSPKWFKAGTAGI